MGISSYLRSSVIGVTLVDERIMLVRFKHTLAFTSLIAIYARTELSELEEKMFYAKLDSMGEQCSSCGTLIVLGDFNAVTGTERAGYELCVGPHGSGNKDVKSPFLLNFAKTRRLRIGGIWFQRWEPRRWIWHSNADGVAKEIDHILASTLWRILQNCRVYRSVEFLATDHRHVVAKLRIHVRSSKIPRYNFPRFYLEKLRDPACTHEYAVAESNRFGVLDTLDDPEEMWNAFRHETLKATEERVRERPRSRSEVASDETLRNMTESRAARLDGNVDQYRTGTKG